MRGTFTIQTRWGMSEELIIIKPNEEWARLSPTLAGYIECCLPDRPHSFQIDVSTYPHPGWRRLVAQPHIAGDELGFLDPDTYTWVWMCADGLSWFLGARNLVPKAFYWRKL